MQTRADFCARYMTEETLYILGAGEAEHNDQLLRRIDYLFCFVFGMYLKLFLEFWYCLLPFSPEPFVFSSTV
jgi:hypothetical protein